MIKRLKWELNLYWTFMCTEKSNDKNKKKSPPPYTSFSAFLIVETLLNLWFWNFQAFNSFLLTLGEKLSVITWMDYFVL